MTLVRSSLFGVGIVATSMLLDPLRGARRRALIRDQMVSATRKTGEAAGATWRNLGNWITGMRSKTKHLFSDEAVDDVSVAERVKSALGRVTAHQRAVSVRTADQCVTLTGDALASEITSIVSAVQRVPGVVSVQNNIRTHSTAEGVPTLQGGARRPGQSALWPAGAWRRTALLAAGVAIAMGAAAVVRSRGDLSSAVGITQWASNDLAGSPA